MQPPLSVHKHYVKAGAPADRLWCFDDGYRIWVRMTSGNWYSELVLEGARKSVIDNSWEGK